MALRPNLICIYVDDVTYDTWDNGFPYLSGRPGTSGSHWVRYANGVIPYSLCGSSRMSLLTGRHAHRHGATTHPRLAEVEPGLAGSFFRHMLPCWLENVGYNTCLIGKYANGYPWRQGDTYIPSGWHVWHGFLDDSILGGTHASHTGPAYGTHDASGYVLNRNGTLETHGTYSGGWSTAGLADAVTTVGYGGIGNRLSASTDYSTDLLGQIACQQIVKLNPPFYMHIGLRATHAQIALPTRHASASVGSAKHQNWNNTANNFNEADISDKPAWLRGVVPNAMGSNAFFSGHDYSTTDCDTEQIARWRCGLSVDELIFDIVTTLSSTVYADTTSYLSNTVIVVMTDNAFINGHHKLHGKDVPYEESIRSSIFVYHPSATERVDTTELAANIDIAPTFCDLAGAKPSIMFDGTSLVPNLLSSSTPVRRKLFGSWENNDDEVEAPTAEFVLTPTAKYVSWHGLTAPRSVTGCTYTTASGVITSGSGNFVADDKNKAVTGTDMPANAYIYSVDSSTQITIRAEQTATPYPTANKTGNGTITVGSALPQSSNSGAGPQPPFAAETELYDLANDPGELVNATNDATLASTKAKLVRDLTMLKVG